LFLVYRVCGTSISSPCTILRRLLKRFLSLYNSTSCTAPVLLTGRLLSFRPPASLFPIPRPARSSF
jgi:hypothetical protein